MTDLAILICAAVVLAVFGFGLDRHLCLKQIEIDLKEHLGDLLVARDGAPSSACSCCRQTSIFAIKGLIRKHFAL